MLKQADTWLRILMARSSCLNKTPRIKEGHSEAIMALMEFDSLKDAERFYNSAEYTHARQFRIASTTGSIVIGEGFVPAQ
jgi:uncharacterized protein (DUF1330 family)